MVYKCSKENLASKILEANGFLGVKLPGRNVDRSVTVRYGKPRLKLGE